MRVVWSERHRGHVPDGELWIGVWIEGTELPARGETLVEAVRRAGIEVVAPRPYRPEALETVHSADLIEFLRTIWDRWQAAGFPDDPGAARVVPYAFPAAAMTSGRPPRRPRSLTALVGMYAMDTMTTIGPGSWDAIEAAAHCALTAADLVVEGEGRAYAAVRPPGHHAGTTFYGGSCYLNNAALAAQRLVEGGAGRVAVIDLDAHHGNGTQEIFYRRSNVRYASVHVDPGEGWFPHYLGFADERGEGTGEGANLNLPLAPGSGDESWLEAVGEACRWAAGADVVVVSLGVDAAAADPESPLEVTVDGYRRAGEAVGALGAPVAIVQEGGYHLPTLGSLVTGFLDGCST
jgi:acetoin utilization deacetylase AcuC-like enzyme